MPRPISIQRFRRAIRTLPSDRPRVTPGKWYLTQKQHWLGWLGDYDGPGYYGRDARVKRDAEFAYNHIVESKMLLWLIQAARVSPARVAEARRNERRATSMQAKSAAVRRSVPWHVLAGGRAPRRAVYADPVALPAAVVLALGAATTCVWLLLGGLRVPPTRPMSLALDVERRHDVGGSPPVARDVVNPLQEFRPGPWVPGARSPALMNAPAVESSSTHLLPAFEQLTRGIPDLGAAGTPGARGRSPPVFWGVRVGMTRDEIRTRKGAPAVSDSARWTYNAVDAAHDACVDLEFEDDRAVSVVYSGNGAGAPPELPPVRSLGDVRRLTRRFGAPVYARMSDDGTRWVTAYPNGVVAFMNDGILFYGVDARWQVKDPVARAAVR